MTGIPDPFVPTAEQEARVRAAKRVRNMRAAYDIDPNVATRAHQLSRETGLDVEAIVDNPKHAEQLLTERDIGSSDFERTNPVLAARLQDARYVPMIRDQLGNLRATEGAFDWIGRSWDVARNTSRRGTIGTMALLAGRDLYDYERAELGRYEELAAAHEARQPGILDEAIGLVGSMADALVTGAASTAAVAATPAAPAAPFVGAAAAFAQSWRVEAGNIYVNLIEEGYTPAEASGIAALYGTAIGAVDVVGLKFAAKPFRAIAGDALPKLFARSVTPATRRAAFGDLLKNYATSALGEAGTEAIQEVIGMLGEERARSLYKPDAPETFDLGRAGEAFTKTLKGMIVLGGIGAGGKYAYDLKRVGDSLNTERAFKAMVADAEKSKDIDPNVRAQFTTEAANANGVPFTYIRAKRFAELIDKAHEAEAKETGRMTTAESLNQLFPGLVEKIRAEAERGGDVALPTGEFEAKLLRTPIGPQLIDHATLQQDGKTPFEGREVVKAMREGNLEQQMRDVIDAQGKATEQWRSESESVYRDVYAQLVRAGRLPEEAEAEAKMTRALATVNARNEGKTPAQYWADAKFTVSTTADGEPAEMFDQTGERRTDSEAFKTYFRDSKVRDENGQPLRVYHGSQRPDRIGSKFKKSRATSGPMAFFTDNPDVASSYATQKRDTSIEMPESYAAWFKVKDGRSTRTVPQMWYSLTPEERATITQRAAQLRQDDAGKFVLDPENTRGPGNFDQALKENRGNALAALVDGWLDSGTLFDNEEVFLDVLRAAGFDRKVELDDPRASKSGVVPVYLSIQNPLDTSAIPAEVTAALEKAGKRKRGSSAPGVDPWDKNTRSGKEWLDALKKDDSSLAWTSIPDWVTETLQELGYDGIKDTGGKLGGQQHTVWIPFEENQVKSVNNRGTWSLDSNDALRQEPNEYFFSALGAQVQVLPQGAAKNAKQWSEFFTSLTNKGLVKKAELEWSGVPEFLAVQEGKVTREQLIEYLDTAGEIKLVNYTYADEQSIDEDAEQSINERFPQPEDVWFASPEPDGEPTYRDYTVDNDGYSHREEQGDPGGTNYREVVVALAREPKTGKEDAKLFSHGHWKGVDNPVLHLRLTDRLNAAREKVLFVEEIQSDWGQEARSKGLSAPVPPEEAQTSLAAATERASDLRVALRRLGADSRPVPPEQLARVQQLTAEAERAVDAEYGLPQDATERKERAVRDAIARELANAEEEERAWRIALATGNRPGDRGVKPGPFARPSEGAKSNKDVNTEAWLALGVKHALQIAVRGGYSHLVFSNGLQNAQHYKMANVAQSLRWTGGTLTVVSRDGDESTHRVKREELADWVGEGIAKQLLDHNDNYKPLNDERFEIREDTETRYAIIDDDVPANEVDADMFEAPEGPRWLQRLQEEATRAERVVAEREFPTFFAVDREDGVEIPMDTREEAEEQIADWGVPPMLEVDDEVVGEDARGMLQFYDKVVPSVVNKVVPKLGGEKMAPVSMGAHWDRHTQNAGVKITEKMRESFPDKLPLFQEGEKGPRGNYVPKLRKILLNPGNDMSTFVHELAHWQLEEMARIAAGIEGTSPGADSSAARDMRTLLNWLGHGGTVREWLAKPLNERRAAHEQFAYNFELYLYGERNAPSREMRSLFQKFARWLRDVYTDAIASLNATYRTNYKRDLPGLTPEIKQVFGRMLASAREVELMRNVDGVVGLFQTEAEFVKQGGTPEDWKALQQAHREDEDEAIDNLTQARMREMGWLSNARGRVLAAIQAQHDDVRKSVRREVEQEVDAMPVSRARHWLRTGELLDETGASRGEMLKGTGDATTHKLLGDVVREIAGPDVTVPKGITHASGWHPDVVALEFGYETGADMVGDLLTFAPRDELVRVLTDERMLAEYAELTDPVLREDAVRAALHNEARRRVIAAELRALEQTGPTEKVMIEAAKEAARRALEGRQIGALQLREFAIAANRAREEARVAFVAGDLAAAKAAKRAEMLNTALVTETKAVRDEIRKGTAGFAKFFREDKKLGKSRDMHFVYAGRAILTRYGIGREKRSPVELLRPIAEYNPTLFAELEPIVTRATEAAIALPPATENGPPPYEFLTVNEFRDLVAVTTSLWQQSRAVKLVTLDGRKQSADAAAGLAVAALDAKPAVDTIGASGAATPWETAKLWAGSYLSNLVRVEHLFRWIDDGNTDGIFSRMFRRVKTAGDTYRVELAKFSKRYEKKLDALKLEKEARRIPAPELRGHVFGRGQLHGKAEVIAVAMHFYGNASNRAKLVNGRAKFGWTEDGVAEFLARMEREGVLGRREFDFIEEVFDMLGESDLKGAAQKAHFEMFGYYFTEIPHTPFTAAGKTYRGGYVPVRFDREIVGDVQMHEQDSMAEFHKSMPTVPRGFTVARVDYFEPISLNLAELTDHFGSVLRFAHLAPAVRDVRRVLNRPAVKNGLTTRFGKDTVSAIVEPWLARASLQSVGTPASTPIEKVISWLARSASMNVMFLNIGNALQNLTGFLPAMREVGGAHVLTAIGNYLRGPKALAQTVAERSTHMSERLLGQTFELRDAVKSRVVQPGLARKLVRKLTNSTYVLQTVTQNFVDVVLAEAMFQQQHAKYLTEGKDIATATRKAINDSDSLVRRSQMAGDPEDVSTFEAGGAIQRALFPFKSWFVNWLNNTRGQTKADKSFTDTVTTYVYSLMLPAVAASLISEVVNGRLADDDDDGWGDEAAALFFRSQIEMVTGAAPGFGDVAKLAYNTLADDDVWNNRMPAPPFLRGIDRFSKVLQDVANGEEFKATPDVISLLGQLSGVPLDALGIRVGVAAGFASGALRSTSTYDDLRALFTGKASREQRGR